MNYKLKKLTELELIEKYFNSEFTQEELIELENYLKKEDNKEVFKTYVKHHYDLDLHLLKIDNELEFTKIKKRIEKENTMNRSLRISYVRWYKAAAVFIGLIGLTYAFYLFNIGEQATGAIDSNAITLTLDNGDVKVIREDGSEKILNKNGEVVGKQEGTTIYYRSESNPGSNTEEIEELVYNELYVPYGKKLKITLSDGTLVHLNAGSSLKYPVKFIKGVNRDVFLNGEAYFDVAKNKNQPFIVNLNDLNVQVLGTQFNVNSYNEDASVNTVLVEGSVALYKNNESYNKAKALKLTPGNLAYWDKDKQQLRVNEVDTDEYTAWTEGILLFKIRPFSEIIKVLERHYDVTIINNYDHLNNIRFFARFDIETIDQVLEAFQTSEPFSYNIQENNITINKPLN